MVISINLFLISNQPLEPISIERERGRVEERKRERERKRSRYCKSYKVVKPLTLPSNVVIARCVPTGCKKITYHPNSTVFKISFLGCGYLTLHLLVFNISISFVVVRSYQTSGTYLYTVYTVIWESSRLLRYHVLVRRTCQAFFGGPVECWFQMELSTQILVFSFFSN